jgi:hypothetical protein
MRVVRGMGGGMRVVSGMFSCGGSGMRVAIGMGGGMRVVSGMFSCGGGGMFTCNSAGGGPDVHQKFCGFLVIQRGGSLQCPRVRV